MLRFASGLLGSDSGSIGEVLAGSALATVRESGAGAGAGAGGVALLSATGADLVSSTGVVAQAATNSKAAPATSRRWVEFILYLPQTDTTFYFTNGPQQGSRTLPRALGKWTRVRPSSEAVARIPRPPASVAYSSKRPLGAKLGDSSMTVSVRVSSCPLARSTVFT